MPVALCSMAFESLPRRRSEPLTDCSCHWHLSAIKSTGFSKLDSWATDELGNPTFEEVGNPQHREICCNAYAENFEYYNRLLSLDPEK